MQSDASIAIGLDLHIATRMLTEKLRMYVDLFDRMERRGGWIRFPSDILGYLQELGVTHWAELFSKDGMLRYQESKKSEIVAAQSAFLEEIGESLTSEAANLFLNSFCEMLTESALDDTGEHPVPGLEFMNDDPATICVPSLSNEELNLQRSVWIAFFVNFYNDMALATHGESLFSLVHKAVEENDDDALVKAIQIDRSLIPYFQTQLWKRSMDGDFDFWDSFSYRANNPTIRGRNEHPLLWVLFKDLWTLGCLNRSVTAKNILDIYSNAIRNHPRFVIEDEAIVQRQRRKFLRMYRQPK